MRRVVVSVLLTLLVLLMPWRVMRLTVAMLLTKPSAPQMVSGDDRQHDTELLAMRLGELGYDVTFEGELSIWGQAVYGYTDKTHHVIKVDEALSWNARYAVLAHEGAHVFQPIGTRADAECFADAVAYLVADDGTRTHAQYLSRSKFDCALENIAFWPEEYAAARLLMLQ